MRMDPDRRADVTIPSGECLGLLARRDVLPGGEDPLYARFSCALEHLADIGRKAPIGQMRMRVDHCGRVTFTNGRAHFCRGRLAVYERSAPSRARCRFRRAL